MSASRATVPALEAATSVSREDSLGATVMPARGREILYFEAKASMVDALLASGDYNVESHHDLPGRCPPIFLALTLPPFPSQALAGQLLTPSTARSRVSDSTGLRP